jgi:glycosyltransferase involved in cell wall biosynthesis
MPPPATLMLMAMPLPPAPIDIPTVLTHHWLVRRRGGEKVLEAFAALFPDAPIYTLVHNPDFRFEPDQPEREIHTSWLQHVPHSVQLYPRLLPLIPTAYRTMRLPKTDLVLCSDASMAKAIPTPADAKLVCFCHSPMRYAYEPEMAETYARSISPMLRPLFRATLSRVRAVDQKAAQRVDHFIANSRHVAKRIERHYGRSATVIHPPVELPAEPTLHQRKPHLLCVGHHVPYKRLDIAVEAARGLQRELVVIGDGPDIRRLRLREQEHVRWLGWVDDDALLEHYRSASALLFPGEEDFGMVPVEAMAYGCPVIAYGVGGACETVIDGSTGILFEQQSGECLAAAIRRAKTLEFDPELMFEHVQKFSYEQFWGAIRGLLNSVFRGR